jgi:hypothetical protein
MRNWVTILTELSQFVESGAVSKADRLFEPLTQGRMAYVSILCGLWLYLNPRGVVCYGVSVSCNWYGCLCPILYTHSQKFGRLVAYKCYKPLYQIKIHILKSKWGASVRLQFIEVTWSASRPTRINPDERVSCKLWITPWIRENSLSIARNLIFVPLQSLYWLSYSCFCP